VNESHIRSVRPSLSKSHSRHARSVALRWIGSYCQPDGLLPILPTGSQHADDDSMRGECCTAACTVVMKKKRTWATRRSGVLVCPKWGTSHRREGCVVYSCQKIGLVCSIACALPAWPPSASSSALAYMGRYKGHRQHVTSSTVPSPPLCHL